MQGSLKPYGTQRNPASVGQDFIGVQPGFIDIGNGESSGTISVTIIDDNIPEIDEVVLQCKINIHKLFIKFYLFTIFKRKLHDQCYSLNKELSAEKCTKIHLSILYN